MFLFSLWLHRQVWRRIPTEPTIGGVEPPILKKISSSYHIPIIPYMMLDHFHHFLRVKIWRTIFETQNQGWFRGLAIMGPPYGKLPVLFSHHSHIFRDSNMGVVWESYGKLIIRGSHYSGSLKKFCWQNKPQLPLPATGNHHHLHPRNTPAMTTGMSDLLCLLAPCQVVWSSRGIAGYPDILQKLGVHDSLWGFGRGC